MSSGEDGVGASSRAFRRTAVFLDRDGTLNVPVIREGKPYAPQVLAEFSLYPGVAEGCARLKAAGFVLVVVTNQPDVERGLQRREVVDAMNARLLELVPCLDRLEVSFAPGRGVSHPDEYRRKPAPGMLTDAAAALGLDLANSWMIGDRWVDVEAGHGAGCRTIWIDRAYDERGPSRPAEVTVSDTLEAMEVVLRAGTAAR